MQQKELKYDEHTCIGCGKDESQNKPMIHCNSCKFHWHMDCIDHNNKQCPLCLL